MLSCFFVVKIICVKCGCVYFPTRGFTGFLVCEHISRFAPNQLPSSFLCQGNFMPGGENGTIMKKCEPRECRALRALMDDPLKDFVPEFKGEVDRDGESILALCVVSGVVFLTRVCAVQLLCSH